jgi:hypothetical protein
MICYTKNNKIIQGTDKKHAKVGFNILFLVVTEYLILFACKFDLPNGAEKLPLLA